MAGSTLSDFIGVTSVADFLAVATFLLAFYGVWTLRKMTRKMRIHHGLRTHLATLYGLGAALEEKELDAGAERVLVKAITREAGQSLEILDEAINALGGKIVD